MIENAQLKAAIIKNIIYFKILKTRGSYQIKWTKLNNDFKISRNVNIAVLPLLTTKSKKSEFFLNCGYNAWKLGVGGGWLVVLAKIEKYPGTFCDMVVDGVVPVWKIPFFLKVPLKEDKVFCKKYPPPPGRVSVG